MGSTHDPLWQTAFSKVGRHCKKEETFCNFEGGEGSQCCQLWENYEENVESVLFLLKHLMVIFLSIGTDTLSVFGLLDLVPKDGAVLKSAIITFRSI